MFQPTGNPTPKVGFCKMGLALSPDGRCKTFDESANGFTRADGAGSIVLELAGEAQKAAWGVGRAWGGWRWCDWGLGWASELLCQVFPWFHRGFSLTNSLHSWVLGQKNPTFSEKMPHRNSQHRLAPEWKARAGHGPRSLCESGARQKNMGMSENGVYPQL